MAEMCKHDKHIMVSSACGKFSICSVCERYYVPTWDFSALKEDTITVCRFCDKSFEKCVCREE